MSQKEESPEFVELPADDNRLPPLIINDDDDDDDVDDDDDDDEFFLLLSFIAPTVLPLPARSGERGTAEDEDEEGCRLSLSRSLLTPLDDDAPQLSVAARC